VSTRALAFTLGAALAVALPHAARAAGEDEFQLSLRLGGANANGYPLAPWGAAAGVDLEYGLDDAWSARVSVGALRHPVDAVKDVSPAGTLQATTALAGATYTFDTLRLVPYASAGLGLVHWSGAGVSPHNGLAIEMGLGGDYLLTPKWAVGASAQYLFSTGDLLGNAMDLGGTALAFSFTARGSIIF
jgi:hypothetical protein